MHPNEYQRLAVRTECDEARAAQRIESHDDGREGYPPMFGVRLRHAAIGIATESGELLTTIKKWEYYGANLDEENLKEEAGDILWYVALLCQVIRVPLAEVMAANIRKLQKRFPAKYTDDNALNRDVKAEMDALRNDDNDHPIAVEN